MFDDICWLVRTTLVGMVEGNQPCGRPLRWWTHEIVDCCGWTLLKLSNWWTTEWSGKGSLAFNGLHGPGDCSWPYCTESDRLLAWYSHPSVCLSVCGYTIHPTAEVSEEVNRRCPHRNTILQLSTPTLTLTTQNLYCIMLIWKSCICQNKQVSKADFHLKL